MLDGIAAARHTAFMGLGDKIKAIRTRQLQLSQAAFADLLGVSQPTVSRWEKEEDTPTDEQLKKLARLAGTTIAELRYGEATISSQSMVSVVWYVGPGERVLMVDEDLSASFEPIHAPPGIDGEELEAAIIRGDNARPLKDGWKVFWRKHTHGVADDCLNHLCVVRTNDGAIYLKEVRRGYAENRFNLVSWNNAFEPIEDVLLEWASPVRGITP